MTLVTRLNAVAAARHQGQWEKTIRVNTELMHIILRLLGLKHYYTLNSMTKVAIRLSR